MFSITNFKKTILFSMSVLIACYTLSINAAPHKEVIWTAVFSNIVPNKSGVTAAYCRAHTPTVLVTTIKQITSKAGTTALNGVNVRYLSYKTEKKDGLYFNIVDAIVSGKDQKGNTWSTPMKLYEQTLFPVGVTWTVWSTKKCRGSFLGTPTEVEKR